MKFATLLTPSSVGMSRTPFSKIPQWAQWSQKKWNIICTIVKPHQQLFLTVSSCFPFGSSSFVCRTPTLPACFVIVPSSAFLIHFMSLEQAELVLVQRYVFFYVAVQYITYYLPMSVGYFSFRIADISLTIYSTGTIQVWDDNLQKW